MNIRVNEQIELEDGSFKTVYSVVIDTNLIKLDDPFARKVYSFIHECMSSLTGEVNVSHDNLVLREIYLGKAKHNKVRSNDWISMFSKFINHTDTSYTKEITLKRIFTSTDKDSN